jgi:DNA-binding transcriptional LysR family regulator
VDARIGCAADVPAQRLQAFLGLLSVRCPDVSPRVVHLTTGQQLRRMRDGDIDLGLVHDPGARPGIAAERVYRGEAPVAVVPVAHRLAGHGPMRIEDLAGDVLLLADRLAEPGVHERVLGLVAAAGVRFRAVREAPGPDLRDLLFAVASGAGVTLSAPSVFDAVGRLGEAVTVRPLAIGGRMPDTCVAWAEGHAPRVRLHAAAREVARELYGVITRSDHGAARSRPRRPCRSHRA